MGQLFGDFADPPGATLESLHRVVHRPIFARMDDLDEISAADLQRLLGLSRQGLSELVAGKVIVRGEKRGRYQLQASVSGYCQHLRDAAAGRGGDAAAEARVKLAEG